MTAIAWDSVCLVADHLATTSSNKAHFQKAVIVEHHKLGRVMFALSGNIKASQQVIRVLEGKDYQEPGKGVFDLEPNASYGLMIDCEKNVYDVYGDATFSPASHVLDTFSANGSAWEFLLGAMAAGANAEQAVALAELHRTDVGFGSTVLNWEEVFRDYPKRPDGDIPW